MTEQWRRIPGYESYEVSDLGRVRSFRKNWTGRLLKQSIDDGYPGVSIYGESDRSRRWPTHRLVLLAFVGPLPEGLHSRHLNGNSMDNRLANLAYGTVSENAMDKLRHGTHPEARKTHCPQGHPYDERNTYFIPSRPRKRYCRTCHRRPLAGEPGRSWAEKTRCPQGHPYDEANTYSPPSRPNARYCRTCHRERRRKSA